MTVQFSWDKFSTLSVPQGQYKTSSDPNVVFSTLLGSCVSVCLFDEKAKVGGLNHFLLPGSDCSSTSTEKFGAFAMEVLINDLLKQGAMRSNLVAKLFGGSAMSVAHEKIGRSNGEFAKNYLKSEGIACTGASLGGNLARRIQFHPTTGRVRQFLVPDKVDDEPIFNRQVAKPAAPADDIVLF